MGFHDICLFCGALKLDCLPRLLPLERDFLSWYVSFAERFLVYSRSNVHSSEECMGPCSRHVYLLRSAHCSDGLHCFSCACQRSPARGCMARRMTPHFSSFQKWHGWLVPVECFWKLLLLFRLLPRFTCVKKFRINPCKIFLQSSIPGYRLVLSKRLGRRVI